MSTKEYLRSLDVKINGEDAKHLRIKAEWRDGSNPISVSVHKKSGCFYDFGNGEGGDFKTLLGLIKGEITADDEKWIEANLDASYEEVDEAIYDKFFDSKNLEKMLIDYDFYLDRGISQETLKTFQCGVFHGNKLNNRLSFPIFNLERKILGFAGRDLTGKAKSKWKILGVKQRFLYPLFANSEYIKEKREIILVESIGDMLKLYDSGIKNVLVLFGTALSPTIMSFLIGSAPRRIIISTNNDGGPGLVAANKIQKKLLTLFGKDIVCVKLPKSKDWGDADLEEINRNLG